MKKVSRVIAMAIAFMMIATAFVGMNISVSAAGTVAKVTSTVKAGSYSTVKTIDLRTLTNGAKIYYTTNGKTPTTKSTKYSKAFTISKTTTIKAIGVKSGMLTSAVATFAYKLNIVPTNMTGTITMSGSSALLPVAQYIANRFKAKNPSLSITVNGGGSGTGLNNVLAGTVDIGNSDVYAAEKLSATDAAKLSDHKVCLIGVAMVVHSEVGALVKNITTANLKKIYDGTYTNWNQLSGPNQAIVVVNRPASSGTRALFIKWAIDGQTEIAGDSSLTTDDSNTLSSTVANTKGAIGYLALSYVQGSTKSFKTLNINGAAPTYSNIYSYKYKVWGYEHMYTKGAATGNAKTFLNYMSTDDLASTYEVLGYGSIKKLSTSAANSR